MCIFCWFLFFLRSWSAINLSPDLTPIIHNRECLSHDQTRWSGWLYVPEKHLIRLHRLQFRRTFCIFCRWMIVGFGGLLVSQQGVKTLGLIQVWAIQFALIDLINRVSALLLLNRLPYLHLLTIQILLILYHHFFIYSVGVGGHLEFEEEAATINQNNIIGFKMRIMILWDPSFQSILIVKLLKLIIIFIFVAETLFINFNLIIILFFNIIVHICFLFNLLNLSKWINFFTKILLSCLFPNLVLFC